MRPLIAGNWKMHLAREAGIKLATEIADGAASVACDLLICPPFPLIYPIAMALDGSDVAIGGQNCHEKREGAYTGDVAAWMLADAGARYVIVGHSERRTYHKETNEEVRLKADAALRAGLVPIVCVGESAEQHAAGQARETIETMLAGSLPERFNGVVAYEPYWAIGTGKIPTPGQAATTHKIVRDKLVSMLGTAGQIIPILYGGSVKASNAKSLLSVPNVNGVLVGGASLSSSEFLGIAAAV